ncbi:MAG: methenyltetrahydromethanopterin cyclohydrolase [Pirellula sp.]|jgi:methenyltetrahydromethanopterin cyclohydrolase|nr:methenyltetrahydromethanopterin cyclohydrolase [Pirellula sp.]
MPQINSIRLNEQAFGICKSALGHLHSWRIGSHVLENGATVIDFGVEVTGGILAGQNLARICLADRCKVTVHPSDSAVGPWPQIQVYTEDPVHACMASQYAGWPVKGDGFFAMGSGPMRAKRGQEPVLKSLGIVDDSEWAVGVLECDVIPTKDIATSIAQECSVSPDKLILCVAPTRSIAGTLQVVARSVETSMHKLFELGFPLHQVVGGHGSAPLPPPAIDFVGGIGRTNDAILYGSHVTLWVQAEDEQLRELGPKIPSCHSKDFGKPFAETFKAYDFDFYKVDPGLFSPAMITLVNLKSGRSWRWGKLRPEILALSFGESLG